MGAGLVGDVRGSGWPFFQCFKRCLIKSSTQWGLKDKHFDVTFFVRGG